MTFISNSSPPPFTPPFCFTLRRGGQYYFWNLTNAEEVQRHHAKPKYEQCGPYVYRQRQERLEVSFSTDGTRTSRFRVGSRVGGGAGPATKR